MEAGVEKGQLTHVAYAADFRLATASPEAEDAAAGTYNATAMPEEMNGALAQWRLDHEQLRAVTAQLERLARAWVQARPEQRPGECPPAVPVLADALLAELERHAQWEADHLFPLLKQGLSPREQGTMLTSLWMLEKEHQLTDVFFHCYAEELQRFERSRQASCLLFALEHLLQACRAVREHLEAEEELIAFA